MDFIWKDEFETDYADQGEEMKPSHVTSAEIHEASTKFMSAIHDLTRPIPEDETEEQKSRRMARARLLSIEFLR